MVTIENIVAAFNGAGIDTPEACNALLKSAALSVRRVTLQAAIAKARAEQQVDNQATETHVQELSAEIATIEAELAGLVE